MMTGVLVLSGFAAFMAAVWLLIFYGRAALPMGGDGSGRRALTLAREEPERWDVDPRGTARRAMPGGEIAVDWRCACGRGGSVNGQRMSVWACWRWRRWANKEWERRLWLRIREVQRRRASGGEP